MKLDDISPPPAVHRSTPTIIDVSEESSYSSDSLLLVKLNVCKNSSPPSMKSIVNISEDEMLEQLPEKRPRMKRAFSLPLLSPHRRLITIMILINAVIFAIAAGLRLVNNATILGYLIISNITAAVLIRQQRVINLLFKLATSTGARLPLSVKWMLAKIYHFGGIHSGCAVSATFWLLLFTIVITKARVSHISPTPSIALLIITYTIDVLLVIIIVLALPGLRMRFHNSFEASHRFLGWTVLIIVWAHTIIFIRDYKPNDASLASSVFRSPSPYLLFAVTISIISPWLSLRKVRVTVTKPSSHAIIVSFTGVKSAFPGSTTSISVDPLFEWHAFADIPTPGKDGFRLIISRAGDWTSRIIDSPPTHFWIRGIRTAGMANIGSMFRSVLFVCTGSGIGPVMPHLLAKKVPSSLFWSARTPVDTYGGDFVQEILQACPDAIIHDTGALGKPDMVATSYRLVKQTASEAVICISNQTLTRKIVYGLESRGIPAFGAIWDS